MKEYDRILSAIRDKTPFKQMFDLGYTPDEVKEAVIETLEPYFENKSVLDQFAITFLVADAINLGRLRETPWFFGMFEKCLSTYRLAKQRDRQRCFESCAVWHPNIVRATSEFWSLLHLEIDKDTLAIEEFVAESVRNIAQIIENVMKYHLKALLHQSIIAGGAWVACVEIDRLTLGNVVGRLIQETAYPELFKPPPWNIKLNQWRNIGHHGWTRIENDSIVCWYGKPPNVNELRFTRDELLKAVHTIVKVLGAIRLAHTLFLYDNSEALATFGLTDDDRHEAQFLAFATGVASQGFEIVSFGSDANESLLVLRDTTYLNARERCLHASQFLVPIWYITGAKRITIEYRRKDNYPRGIWIANGTDCEKLSKGEIQLSEFDFQFEYPS